MKYTKNIGLKLRHMGFEFISSNGPEDDADLSYEVYRKGVIEVTVEHSPGKLIVVDIAPADNVKCNTLNQLAVLDCILN